MSKIITEPDVVRKTFDSPQKYKTELKYRPYFSDNFYVPQILSEDEGNLTLSFERVKSPLLSDSLNKLQYRTVEDLFRGLPAKRGKTTKKHDVDFLRKELPETPNKILMAAVSEEEGFLIHGDFRPQNIFIMEENFGLIDFESAGYSFPERDKAYFYMEVIHFNPEIGQEFLERMKRGQPAHV